ncbi:MsnO8 family LLM class oxidoreductase [Streptomyces sp. NBC_01808]|uniref:MsnO8 family LLM class oxidoreductase n=1 Tax=Streptomyces sp. NBC_01808 TaxID=2975947 RepID=UPI002DD8AF84|nr:MsnO8 family LLM class oxidoreductase [Streptomyces sp. NBC_01808]WSA41371.1 MsnO8 family LLM class oxidoreductase [Streptomyces sp. NBC_01808]
MDIPLSVLDRSLRRKGQDPADALRRTVRFAQQMEGYGFRRFWVSEHHSVPGVAGSAPTVLAAAVAAATSRIRVGTGGVMLPNHRPLVVAEQFGVLGSLFPDRIDMGLGRSLGFTDGIRRALGHGMADAGDFGAALAETLRWFEGTQPAYPGVHAVPAEGLRVPAYVLAIDGGADIAAAHGLPLVIGAGRRPEKLLRAVERYREAFTPSAQQAAPYVVVAVAAAVADTAEQAADLLLPEAWATVWSRTRGEFPPLTPAAEIRARTLTEREARYLDEARQSQVSGTGEQVAAALGDLVARSGADELLVSLHTPDEDARLESFRRLAELKLAAPAAG